MNSPADIIPTDEIQTLREQLALERENRLEAERIAEKGMRSLYEKQAELTLLSTTARASNEATTIAAAFFGAIRAICSFTGWQVGHAFVTDISGNSSRLIPMGIWYMTDAKRFSSFRVATESTHHTQELGLPNTVLTTAQPAIASNLSKEKPSPRQAAAFVTGLTCGYAFPVLAAQRVNAVIEFYSTKPFRETEPFFELTAQISAQLGRVVERNRAERSLRLAQLELERKVDERTRELAHTVEELNHRIEEQRRIQSSLLVRDHAISSAVNGIVITDATLPDNPMIYCNPAFERITGYSAAEALGRNCRFLRSAQSDPVALDTIRTTLRDGRTCRVTILNERKDGTPFWNHLTLSAVRSEDGRITHYIGVQEDVTEQKRMEEIQRRAREATESANAELARAARLKDEFLAAMSHELRTPLNGILGLSESLLEEIYGTVSERQRGAITTIDESGRHLLSLINDILDLSKIEAGKLELEIGPVDIYSVAQASIRFVREIAVKKSIRVACNISADVNLVAADQRRLKQMLVNLLSNAVKFTPEGGQVGLEITKHPTQSAAVFTVWDTGIGISPEDRPKLFRPFIQIDSSLSRRFEGTGLGLALVRLMAELHKGTISLESELGKGSRFHITLPVAEDTPQAQPPASKPAARAAQEKLIPAIMDNKSSHRGVILLAEDNATNVTMFTDFLQAKGYKLIFAQDGAEAVIQTRTHRPDIVLMDIQMPGVDGISAIRQIRSDTELAPTPIIALTALAMNGDRERCMAAGADEYLSKPVSLRTLGNAIEAALQRAATASPAVA